MGRPWRLTCSYFPADWSPVPGRFCIVETSGSINIAGARCTAPNCHMPVSRDLCRTHGGTPLWRGGGGANVTVRAVRTVWAAAENLLIVRIGWKSFNFRKFSVRSPAALWTLCDRFFQSNYRRSACRTRLPVRDDSDCRTVRGRFATQWQRLGLFLLCLPTLGSGQIETQLGFIATFDLFACFCATDLLWGLLAHCAESSGNGGKVYWCPVTVDLGLVQVGWEWFG